MMDPRALPHSPHLPSSLHLLVGRHRKLLAIFGVVMMMVNCQLVDRALQSGSAATHGVDRDTSIFLAGGQPLTLDPAKTLGGPDGPLGHIFSGLVSLDTDLQVQPDLAAGWTVSDDGLVYTFFLHMDAVFHDGRPVTAADIIYSWNRAADPATGSDTVRTYLGDIVGVDDVRNGAAVQIAGLRAIDDHTLEVRLTGPVVYFLAKLAYPVAFVVDEDDVAQRNWEHEPNGTGPFKLEVWQDDEIIVLARNELYYGEKAHISHLVYELGAGIPMSMYETDEIDLVYIGSDTLERARDPNSPLAQQLKLNVSMCTSTIGLNNRIAPFDDVRVRQAFNYAVDKQLLIEAFSGGNALVAIGPLPPAMPGYTGVNRGYPYDPEKARGLLAQAGYPDGDGLPNLTYTTSGYGDVGPYETALITMWQENLGVVIEPAVIDPFIYYDELYDGDVGNLYSSGWCADYPDPQNFLDILYHSDSDQNIGGFTDPLVDTLLEEARVEPDVTDRMALYAEAERMIVDEAPVVFLSHNIVAVLVKPRVQGYRLTPIGVPQWHRISLSE